MKISEIILLILTSSVVASALTLLGNRFLISTNYKHDYYKKIIDQRLSAYEGIDRVINELATFTQLESGEIIHTICYNKNSYDAFNDVLSEAMDKGIWFSTGVSEKITEINIFILGIHNKINANNNTLTYQQLGTEYFSQLKEFKSELKDLMNNDLESLHLVKGYFKEKRKED